MEILVVLRSNSLWALIDAKDIPNSVHHWVSLQHTFSGCRPLTDQADIRMPYVLVSSESLYYIAATPLYDKPPWP